MKKYIPALFVIGALLLLANPFPKQVVIFLWLVLILLMINKWSSLSKIFG